MLPESDDLWLKLSHCKNQIVVLANHLVITVAVVVNYLVEVKSTPVQIWSELVATLLASHYNHCVLFNKHKNDGHVLSFPC